MVKNRLVPTTHNSWVQFAIFMRCILGWIGHCYVEIIPKVRSYTLAHMQPVIEQNNQTHVAKFMGPSWGPPGSCQPQMGPILASWTLLSGEWLPLCLSGWSLHIKDNSFLGLFSIQEGTSRYRAFPFCHFDPNLWRPRKSGMMKWNLNYAIHDYPKKVHLFSRSNIFELIVTQKYGIGDPSQHQLR